MSEPDLEAYGELAADIKEMLISGEELQRQVSAMARAISHDYAGLNPLLVGVLKGVLFFMADLLRKTGLVRLEKDLEATIKGRHVLFVEDVIDTGLTLNYLLHNLQARQPASLEVCVLFNKPKNRLIEIPLKYKGFDLPDRFVVGYGLDFRERYRNLPFVGLLKPHVLQRQKEE
jgi:hypoxanthine phosphoribosyltransferase